MRISVGIDIAKEIHWVTAIDADGVVQIDRKLLNTPTDIASLADQLANPGDTVRIGIDVIGGIAGLAEAILAEAGFTLVHVPGLAVNRRGHRPAGSPRCLGGATSLGAWRTARLPSAPTAAGAAPAIRAHRYARVTSLKHAA